MNIKRLAIAFLLLILSINSSFAQYPSLWGMNSSYAGGGNMFNVKGDGTSYVDLNAFPQLNNVAERPDRAHFIKANDGNLYALTEAPGGAIIKLDSATNEIKVVMTLSSANYQVTGAFFFGSLIQATNGKLYGMTSSYGANNSGTIFSYNYITNTYTKVHDFKDTSGSQPNPGQIQATNGKIYGLTKSGGKYGKGVLYSFDPTNNTYQQLFSFSDSVSGINPPGGLLQASNGKLYGITGGKNQTNFPYGCIFSYDIDSAKFSVAWKITSATLLGAASNSFIEIGNGKLYSVSPKASYPDFGNLSMYDITTDSLTILHTFKSTEGVQPVGTPLYASNGKIYGTTETNQNATINGGTIYEYNINTNTFTKLHNFNDIDGGAPNGKLTEAYGKLWGLTNWGGYRNAGVVYNIDLATGKFSLHTVLGSDYPSGKKPRGSLTYGSDKKIYGLTHNGGLFNMGVLFSYDSLNKKFSILHHFTDSLGGNPSGNLLEGANGIMYGVTDSGGVNKSGTIFSYSINNNTYTKLVDLTSNGGSFPFGSLILARNGKLYGMTNGGGANNVGVIFSYDPVTNVYTKLFNFIDSLGKNPYGSLLQAIDGNLYGMTSAGGDSAAGVIFKFNINNNSYSKLYSLRRTIGTGPYGNLIQAPNGLMYGIGYGGGQSNYGTLFRFDPATNTAVRLHSFSNVTGPYWPKGSPMLASDGNIYGLAGGNTHVVYRYNMVTDSLTHIKTLSGQPDYSTLLELIPRCTNSISQDVHDTICTGETFLFNGKPLSTAGMYSDTVKTVMNCDSIITLYLFVRPTPSISIDAIPDTVCINSAPIGLSGSPAGGVFSVNGLTNDTVETNATGKQLISYLYTDNYGCSNSAADSVIIDSCSLKNCKASFVIYPDSVNQGVYWGYNESIGSKLSFFWDFGDSSTSTSQFPSHTYAQPGRYYVCLSVNDGNGCTDTYCDSSFYVFKTEGGLMFQLNILNPLSIDNINKRNVKIYPNPFRSTVVVDLGNDDTNIDNYEVFITDMLGKEIKSVFSVNTTNIINLHNYASGSYYLHVKTQDETVVFKIIKLE